MRPPESEHSRGQEEGEKAEAGEPRENLDSRGEGGQHEKPPGLAQALSSQVDIDPYQIAEVIYNARVEQLKQEGWLRRVEDIRDEWELDDHFDDLRRIYQEICWVMGLAWPPPPRGKS